MLKTEINAEKYPHHKKPQEQIFFNNPGHSIVSERKDFNSMQTKSLTSDKR